MRVCVCVCACVGLGVENYHCILEGIAKVLNTHLAAQFALHRNTSAVCLSAGLSACASARLSVLLPLSLSVWNWLRLAACHCQIALKSFDMLRQVCHMSWRCHSQSRRRPHTHRDRVRHSHTETRREECQKIVLKCVSISLRPRLGKVKMFGILMKGGGKPYGPIVRTDLQQPPRRSLGYLLSCLPISMPSYLSLSAVLSCAVSLCLGCHCRCCCCCFAYFSIKSDLNTLLGFSFTSCTHTYRGICHYIYNFIFFSCAGRLWICPTRWQKFTAVQEEKRERERDRRGRSKKDWIL